CESETCTTKGWDEMVAQVKAAGDLMAQVKLANSLVNSHPYIEDMKNWGKADFWATPYEFLKKSGDAEDYAIAKYFLLRAAGVAAADMQIVAVRIRNLNNIGHAILLVRTGANASPMVLDNRAAMILDAALLKKELQPVLGLN